MAVTQTAKRPRRHRERPQPSEGADPRQGHAHTADAEGAVNSILGPNPFIGLDTQKVVQSTEHLLGRLSRRPRAAFSIGVKAVAEISKVVLGRSKVGPAKGDKRFTDPAWADHPGYHRLMQSYLVLGSALHHLVPVAELD